MKNYSSYILLILLKVSISLLTFSIFTEVAAQDQFFVPDDPRKGIRIFEQKGCIKCHAVLGEGAFIGPDLSKKLFYGDFFDLGSIMWIHSPDMSRLMNEMMHPRPTFTVKEIQELFIFLHYLKYLGEPGDPAAGKKLFTEKGCATCHSSGKTAPKIEELSHQAAPIKLAQAMWNHGPKMDQQMKNMGLNRPRFQGEEITHLAAYLYFLNGGDSNERKLVKPGNPKTGKQVFENKGCAECYTVLSDSKGKDTGLADKLTHKSVTEIAGIMWNHGPKMWKELGKESTRVRFEDDEMADIIAFLYLAGFMNVTGQKEKGEEVFREKSCYICHDKSAGETFVVDLKKTNKVNTPEEMIQMMWNHASGMEMMMNDLNILWPNFEKTEMKDLYIFIKSIQIE